MAGFLAPSTINGRGYLAPEIATAAPAADTTGPTLSGVLSITGVTQTGFTVSYSAATDNVGVVGYEISVDTGTAAFTQIGNVLTYNVTGKAPSTAYTVRVRAYDAANNKSNVITTTVTTNTALDTTNPAIPGVLTISAINTSGFTVAWQAGTDNIGITGYEVSADTGVPSYSAAGMSLSKVVAGLDPTTTYTVRVRAFDAAGNTSTPLTTTATTATPIDSAEPIWEPGSVVTASNITSTGLTASWPAATDLVGVVSYEVSVDTGTPAYENIGTSRTKTATGLTSGTLHTIRVRASDAAGNKSAPLTVTATTTGTVPVGVPSATVSKASESPVLTQLSTLTSTPVVITYKVNTGQEIVLFNNSGSTAVATLKGSTAGAVTTKGLAGVTVDLSGGLPISVPSKQFVTLKLDNATLYLKGVVTLTSSANGAIFAGVLQ